jgi:hypothetical protein
LLQINFFCHSINDKKIYSKSKREVNTISHFLNENNRWQSDDATFYNLIAVSIYAIAERP